MAAVKGSDRYARVETFLDGLDRVEDPAGLEEPFRSLWIRAHGDMPTLMTEDEMKLFLHSGISAAQLSDVEITPSETREMEGAGKSSIEVVSPKEVGPTVEMKVEDRSVTFKAAGEDDIKRIREKEEAAGKVVNIQKLTSPLRGVGGEAARVISMTRDMAVHYRDGDYDKVVGKAEEIEERLSNEDFRKSIIVEMQKKITEYEGLGGDLTLAKGRFREMAVSLKEGRDDFFSLLQATNSLAEDSIKDLVTVEDVVVAEVKEPEIEKEKLRVGTKVPVKKRIIVSKPPVEEKQGKEDVSVGSERTVTEEVKGPEPKPVIKIIKKKVIAIKKEEKTGDNASVNVPDNKTMPVSREGETSKEDSEEEFSIDLDRGEDSDEEVPRVDETLAGNEKGVEEERPEMKDSGSGVTLSSEKGPGKEAINEAFGKIRFVYNASVKMHDAGKDVSQIFDLMNIAEQARQNGDMKMYVGLAGQLENMLIALQR